MGKSDIIGVVMNTVFLFDLDSTVTKQEILPTIAREIGKENEMRELTEKTMMGDLPFSESFTERVKLLSDINVSKVSELVSNIELSEKIVSFIQKYNERCYIVTSNLDVWIKGLIDKIGLSDHCFCSSASVSNDKITEISKIIAKDSAIDAVDSNRIVAIGDGSNDYDLIKRADIGISYGGVRDIAPCLYQVSDYSVFDEDTLCNFLEKIVRDENEE